MMQEHGTPWLEVLKQKSMDENLDILIGVAAQTACRHAQGMIHGNLKPKTVMLGENGEVLELDRGLALPTKKRRDAGNKPEMAQMGGTPGYMAPEMVTGPADKIDVHSDVYLLGAILFELITGNPPHHGQSAMECMLAAARNQIRPHDEHHKGELLDVAFKAMATDPQNRYQTAREFQHAVRSANRG